MSASKKLSVALLAITFSTGSYAAFVDGNCPTMASADYTCTDAMPFPTGWYVANGVGNQSLQYALGLQNYGSIVAKSLVGDPIETVIVPSCFTITTSCTNPWASSLNPTLTGAQVQVTVSSSAGSDGNGNLVFPNQADANYKLVAHPDYCSCGYYSGNESDEYCQPGYIVKAISAGVPFNGQYNPTVPVFPFAPCASGTYPNGTPNDAGFWVLNLVSPSGEIPPAGNYQANVIVDFQASNSNSAKPK